MKSRQLSRIRLTRPRLLSFFSIASLMFSLAVFCQIGRAQQQPAQLSLADVLIALRSKKVSLDERNKILSEAVRTRGITFSLTPEIEVELAGGGANGGLVEAIRQKSINVKIAAVTKPAAPQPAPAPVLDHAFYRRRADENAGKGEYELAVSDYTKALELNPKDAAAHLARGRAYASKKSYDLAMLDFNKTIEFDPKAAAAYFSRAELSEVRGNAPEAMADYRKAVEFDAGNEAAKNNLKRLQDEQAKAEQARVEQEKIEQARILAKRKEEEAALAAAQKPQTPSPVAPKSVELGSMIAQAVKMVVPIYPPIARQSSIAGQVTVQITINEKGEVTAAKAVSGPAMLRSASEEAARKTRFKPALINNEAVKASGYVVYSFTGK